MYLCSKNNTRLVRKYATKLPSQHKTGGQSAQRFERLRDEKIESYVKKIIDIMIEIYTKNGKFAYANIIIAGCGLIKNNLCNHAQFEKYFAQCYEILAVAEVTDTTINGILLSVKDSANADTNFVRTFRQKLEQEEFIDTVVFGTANVLEAFDANLLRECYISSGWANVDQLRNTKTKTIIKLISDAEFISNYGELVGIKYYAN